MRRKWERERNRFVYTEFKVRVVGRVLERANRTQARGGRRGRGIDEKEEERNEEERSRVGK